MNGRRVIVFIGLCLAAAGFAAAEAPDPDPGRFAATIASFGSWDNKNAVPADAILFVGSSSIRYWPTAMAFPGKPVINRGFGGSELSDVIHYYDQVIRPYGASRIVLYGGDNDIGRGKTAAQVFDDFRELAGRVAKDFPEAELIFIAIKPSKARWAQWPIMTEANRLIEEYTQEHANLRFADLASPLLDEAGEPRNVYLEDGLHLNEWGYALWQQALLPFLEQ